MTTALDPQLAQLPAFGSRRPDEAWLGEQLCRSCASLAAAHKGTLTSSGDGNAVDVHQNEQQLQLTISDLLLQCVDAAAKLLQDSAPASRAPAQQAGSSSKSSAQLLPGASLLEAVCSTAGRLQNPDLELAPVILKVLQLVGALPHISQPKSMPAALNSVAAGAAAAGDLEKLQTFLQQAADVGLSSGARGAMLAAAVGTAAQAAVSPGGLNGKQLDVLLELWPQLVTEDSCISIGSATAAALVMLMSQTPSVGQQLLTGELPVVMLQELLQAALTNKSDAALLELLQHCSNQKQLPQLPVDLLSSIAAAPLPAFPEAVQARQQVVGQLLQQGRVPSATASAALLRDVQQARGSSMQEQWQQLLGWLCAECRSCPAPAAASALLYQLLVSTQHQQASPDWSWQLYELLLSCQEGWEGEHQGLPAAAADALIWQQGQLSRAGDGRVLQVWKHYSSSGDMIQLQPTSQQQVVTGLVKAGNHYQALALVQQVPQQLGTLVGGWREQQQQEGVGGQAGPELLEAAMQLAVKEGTAAAATAADTLVKLAREQQGGKLGLVDGLAADVLQHLCIHGKVAAAADLLPHCATADSVVQLFTAAAKQQEEEQQSIVDVISVKQQLLWAAFGQLLNARNAGAVGLLWQVLHGSKAEGAFTVGCLGRNQQLQLVELCCSISKGISAAPCFTPKQLAEDALDCAIQAEAAARLISAMAKGREELQPCRAAVVLGLVMEDQLIAAGGSSSSSSSGSKHGWDEIADVPRSSAAEMKECLDSVNIIARLCYGQLRSDIRSRGGDIAEVEEAVDWVAQLTPEGAAAALFATQYSSQQDGSSVSLLAAGVLGLSLYHAARKGDTLSAASGWTAKPSLDSLVLDLALVAAAGAGQWEEGKQLD